MVEFQLLGPLAIRDGEVCRPVRGRRQQLLLAALLLRANQTVPVDRLIEAVWGSRSPDTAPGQVRDRVRLLRQALAACPSVTDPSAVLVTAGGGGYRLVVASGGTDLDRFTIGAEAGRAALAAGRAAEAARTLRMALDLWRDEPLAGLDADWLTADVAGWQEQRYGVLEDRIDADLHCGRHREVVAELISLVAVHPLRERLRAQLMIALHRVGRSAEALATFDEARRVLADQIGVTPSAELADLAQSIRLGNLPVAGYAELAADGLPSGEAGPCQLPAPETELVGREPETATILHALDDVGPDVRVLVVTGAAGAGKTALAIWCAHRLRDAFPGGQLYASLGGASRPASASEVQERVLRSLGVVEMPADAEVRTAVYRDRLAGRRVLLVLDDAANEAQLRGLVPGRGAGVLVTSRSRLSGLTGAQRLELGPLSTVDARRLFCSWIGQQRAAAEPAAVDQVVGYCDGVPLALHAAGARLAARRQWTVAAFAQRLAEYRHRLDELAAGDRAVRASLAVSYDVLDEAAKGALCLLAVTQCPSLPGWAVAALVDADERAATAALDRLIEVHLVEALADDPTGQTRYRLHDLVRLFAAERAVSDEPADRLRSARSRLEGAYLSVAAVAADNLPSRFFPTRRGSAAHWAVPEAVRKVAATAPLDWFDAELDCLAAAVHNTDDVAVAWELVGSLGGYLTTRNLWQHLQDVGEHALSAALVAGDLRGEAYLRCLLAELEVLRYNDLEAAAALLEQALPVLLRLGDRHFAAYATDLRGVVHRTRGDLPEAYLCFASALRRFRRTGDRAGEAHALHDLGILLFRQGRHRGALRYLHRAAAAGRAAGDQRTTGYSLMWLGRVTQAMGERADSAAYLRLAMDELTALGEPTGVRMCRRISAANRLASGDLAGAREDLMIVLEEAERVGHDFAVAAALHGLAEVSVAVGDDAGARRLLHRARDTVAGTGHAYLTTAIDELLAKLASELS